MTIIKETSPHLRRPSSVSKMMLNVVIALLPTIIFSLVAYTWRAAMVIGISVGVMLLSEFVYVLIRNQIPRDGQKHSFKERFLFGCQHYSSANLLSSLVSALIFAMIMPATADWYHVLIGALIGIVFGKLVFGGLGSNIFNPALIGMVSAKLCFGAKWKPMLPVFNTNADAFAGGTALGGLVNPDTGNIMFSNINNHNVLDLFLGNCPGTLGEISAICILVGAIYLLITRAADFRAMLSYIGTFTVLMIISYLVINPQLTDKVNFLQFMGFQLFSGGIMFGAAFMITDPVTSPTTKAGRVIYGSLAGIIVVFIRLFAALPEGVAFSILIANMFAPVIDYYKWSPKKYTWKVYLTLGLMFGISIIILILGLWFGGVR